MSISIAKKLKIKPDFTLLSINAPNDFKKELTGLPPGTRITDSGKDYDQVHWFVLNRAQVEKELSKVMKLLRPGVIVWAYYPKRTSGIQTDLTRDKGWDCLQAEDDKLTWISLVSFNKTWSVFGFRSKTDADKKKVATPKVREVFDWVNPKTKEVKIPDDMAVAFKINKKQSDFFSSLSFTNKKEYIEWIVTAKREETRKQRIKETVERLGMRWKNPANR